ncbi:MAG: HEAT repeat domain-containing protein [Gammaproteobacteria bacterium]
MRVQGISRSSLTLVGLFALGVGSILGYSYATRGDAPGKEITVPAVSLPEPPQPIAAAATTAEVVPSPPPAEETPAQPEFPSDAELRSDALAQDALKAESAIETLARMPKERAVPVLRQIVTSGDEKVRVLALHALRTLALNQGDADGAVRNVVREAIYHGDNEDVTHKAQAVLADVENAASAPKSRR